MALDNHMTDWELRDTQSNSSMDAKWKDIHSCTEEICKDRACWHIDKEGHLNWIFFTSSKTARLLWLWLLVWFPVVYYPVLRPFCSVSGSYGLETKNGMLPSHLNLYLKIRHIILQDAVQGGNQALPPRKGRGKRPAPAALETVFEDEEDDVEKGTTQAGLLIYCTSWSTCKTTLE